MPKNPRTPGDLTITPADVRLHGITEPIYRIHAVRGRHPLPWNGLREFGPLPQMRWDPQPEPMGPTPGIGVAYCGTDPTTCFAEVFQSRRTIRLTADRALTGWYPSRPLRLLDLTGLWAVRNGASASLHAAPKPTCRAWSQAICALPASPALDGIRVPSTLTLRPMLVLFASAASAFPAAPEMSELLTHSLARTLAFRASRELGWPIL